MKYRPSRVINIKAVVTKTSKFNSVDKIELSDSPPEKVNMKCAYTSQRHWIHNVDLSTFRKRERAPLVKPMLNNSRDANEIEKYIINKQKERISKASVSNTQNHHSNNKLDFNSTNPSIKLTYGCQSTGHTFTLSSFVLPFGKKKEKPKRKVIFSETKPLSPKALKYSARILCENTQRLEEFKRKFQSK